MTAKRGNGEGSIYRRKDGRWVGVADLGWRNGRRQRKLVYGRTMAEARAKLRSLQRSVEIGVPAGSAERLGRFMEWWLGTLEAKAASDAKSVLTVDNAGWAVRRWIKPHLDDKRLRELTPDDVEGMLGAMVAAGLSRRSVSRVKSYLGQALAVAERRGKVSRNVARIAEMPATAPPAEGRALTAEDAKRVLETAKGDRLEALFVVALMLGLRPGELTGLRWEDLDLSAGTLRVEVSLKRERGQYRLGDPKTARSKRTLDLPSPVLAALRTHRKRQLEERMAAGSVWVDNGLVFTTEAGAPIHRSSLRRVVARLTNKAEVPYVSPNELGRHSAASLLYDAGVGLEQIADLLGHRSTRMLEQHYRHQTRPSVSIHVEVMDGLFGGN